MKKLIPLDPTVGAIQVEMTDSLWCRTPLQRTGDYTLQIWRAGTKGRHCCSAPCCADPCLEEIVYTAQVDWPMLTFAFDERVWDLRKGRYEGVIMLGREEVECRLQFLCDSHICFKEPTVTTREVTEPIDPHCEPCCPVLSQCCGQVTDVRYEVNYDPFGSTVKVIEMPVCGCEVMEPICVTDKPVTKKSQYKVEDTDCGKQITIE